jgi:Ca2+-binding EF-hand superfamily protein
VSQDVDMSAARDMAAVMRVAEAIAASLKHNELDVDEGFRAFDEDEDDLLSLQDLVKSAVTLQLDLSEADLEEFRAHMLQVGGGSDSGEQQKGWRQVLENIDGTALRPK